jgi:hypothetical protein
MRIWQYTPIIPIVKPDILATMARVQAHIDELMGEQA